PPRPLCERFRYSLLLHHPHTPRPLAARRGAGAPPPPRPSRTPGIGPVAWGADGAQSDVITQSASWQDLRTDHSRRFPALTMKGQTVFRWAVFEMAKAARQALDTAGITAADLAAFVPHQANLRIVEALAKALKLPGQVAVARDVQHTGNTSAASIPLAMERMLASGEAPRDGLALTIGFGAGLSYAAQVVVLP
ncbi:3-oxoacyl-[acyl-carrier-protein] synthase III C-terminal domain-containing protein, partial [Streptomyces sp. NPDC127079]|uniref:3-oxoacyl-[acyl-carrier-protein] synthase III C-terminal domain-containing protein n=1 Tax=Streptomyces sp. NPDC127079 TaxID=3347132 RepID=UPI00364E65B2